MSTEVFKVSHQDGVCIIDFNDSSKSLNAFSRDILAALDTLLEVELAKPDISGLVFTSTKKNCFAAGVDISIFDSLNTKEAGEDASRSLHGVFKKFEQAKVPTVAAIHGVCLGGGLEMSLACHYRVCTTHSSTQLGLPEVQLGLLPGGGGTQRLPRLIGLAPALDLILTGKKVDGKKAFKLGLVDDAVPENQLLDRALRLIKENKNGVGDGRKSAQKSGSDPGSKTGSAVVKSSNSGSSFWSKLTNLGDLEKQLADIDVAKFAMESNPLGRSIVEKKSLEQVEKNTKGHYPAPVRALEAVMRGTAKSLEEGLAIEAKLFGELVVSKESRSLVHVFNMMTAGKKNPFDDDTQKQSRAVVSAPLDNGAAAVGILGAGLMGSGIATVLSDKGVRSVLIDRDSGGVQRGLKSVAGYFDERVLKRRIKRFDREAAVARVIPALDYRGLKNTPLVIEAVFEDVKIKHDVLKKCEASIQNADFIFATNTSSLPISKIAEGAKKPENVVGMHFFSPVPKMPLVEIIITDKTNPVATSAVFDLATKMGKQVIVVKDGPGFYTTRILAFQIAEALNILSEGARIEDIDSALEKFGMPVGPITLLDEVGIDVGNHIIEVLGAAFADRLVIPKELEPLIAEDRKGRKNNKGFYTYVDGKKDKPDTSVYKHLKHGAERKNFDRKEIADRCVYVFMNEAARCLDEGILKSADDGDMGAIFGLGFPPFLGGPFHYASTLGKECVKETLEGLASKYGERFKPAAYWSKV